MRVYHFVNKEYGLKDLREKRLKISRIMDLNDPFEFLGADLSDREFRKAMKATKKELSKTSGILCFSKNWSNPVQWAHYADRHKGLCLGFDVPDKHLSKVKYVRERLLVNSKTTEKLMLKLLTTKFHHWHYEQEYRAFVNLEEEDNGLYYTDFSEIIKLRQVIIGAHSAVTNYEVNEAIGNTDHKIEIFKARAAFRKFEIVRNRNEELYA